MANTLLDAFVRVAVDPGSPVEQQLQDLFLRLQAQFGAMGKSLGSTMAAAVAGGGGVGGGGVGGGGGGGGGVKKSVAGLFKNMREEVLKFQRSVALVKIDIRPTGDADLTKRLRDAQDKVQAAQAQAKQQGASRADRAAALRDVQQANQDLQKIRSEALSLNSQSGISGAGDQLKQQIFAARQEATGLRQEMQEVGRVVKQSRDAGLIENFQRAQEEARRLATNVRDALQQADLPGADAALNGLRSLSQEFQRLQSGAQSRLNFDVELDLQDRKFKEELRKVNAEINFQSVVGSGSLSVANKVELARLRKEVELAELAIDNMNGELAKTPDLLQRLNAAKIGLLELKDGMVGVYQGATVANGTLNNLNNNMYQLGQAIEDFSVGFELNGLKGGIRGAANNVSFLVNNMGQALARSQLISESWRNSIGLISGVGAAIGILVIPRLVEWVQNLDEVNLKTRDITRRLEEAFRKSDFDIELDIKFKDFRQALSETDELTESLAVIIELQKEASNTRLKLFADANVFANLRKDLAQSFDEMQQVAEQGAVDLVRTIQNPVEKNLFRGRFWSQQARLISSTIENALQGKGLDFIAEDLKTQVKAGVDSAKKDLKQLTDIFDVGAGKVKQSLLEISNQARTGAPDPAPFNAAADAMEKMIQEIEILKKVVTDTAKLDALEKTLESSASKMRDAAEAAEELARSNKELETRVTTDALSKVSQLNDEYQFQLDVLEKRRSKEEELIDQQRRQTEELKKQLKLFEDMRNEQKANPATTKTLIDAAKKRLLLEQQIDLLNRIKELEEQDPGKSRRGSPDDFFVGVDAGSKEEDKLQKELRLLREAVNKNREALEGRGAGAAGGGVFAPRTLADAREDRRSRNLPEENERRRREKRGASTEERAARERAIAEEIQAERSRKRAERAERSPQGETQGALTRDQQEAADQAELIRLQQERQRIRDESEQRKKDEAEAFRRSDEARKQERDDAMNELRKRSEERARGESPASGQEMRDEIRRQQKAAEDANKTFIEMGKNGLPFTSETIEKLLEASNKTLEAINQGIAKFDTAARVA